MLGCDIDCFNDEQRAWNYARDCLEFWEYLEETWRLPDNSDELYEARRDDNFENIQLLSELED